MPLPPHLLEYRPVASLRILDRQGNLLHELLSRDDGRAVPLSSAELPSQLRSAFLAAEDHGFYSHPGVSLRAIARAVRADLSAGRIVEGGSTLTQQLARRLIPRPRTWLGKAQEALWALRLEAHVAKDELLAQYLNRVSFGSGTFGVEAASQLYFGRSARDLSLAQAAALASLPRGPSAYHPLKHPQRLRERQGWILRRMTELEMVSLEDAARAQNETLDLTAFTAQFRAPHFVRFVATHLSQWGLEEASEVRTSLDPSLQRELENAVEAELAALKDRQVHQAAAVILDNQTGEVLAYVGSRDFFEAENAGQFDGVQVRRQPGSALKPFVYAQALDSGLTPATVLSDTPASFEAPTGAYHPKNYDLRFHGPVRIREALANSLNVPAVRLAERLGPDKIRWGLRRAGFDSLSEQASHYGLGLALGNGEVALWELARAYSGLARGGKIRGLVTVLAARTADGRDLKVRSEHFARRFATASSAALVTDILSDPAARARAFGLENVLRFSFPVAAKTGTSKNFADNWTAGYTHERTVAVWVGNFDRQPMREVSGVSGAGPLFHHALVAAMRNVAPAALVTEPLSRVFICPLSGERASPACPHRMEERFQPGSEPKQTCKMHQTLEVARRSRYREHCRRMNGWRDVVTDVGPDFYAWAAHSRREGWEAAACAAPRPAVPRILTPQSGDSFVLLDDLPLSAQSIPLRVRASASGGPLEVRLDGAPVFALQPPFVGRLAARLGRHVLTLHRPGDDKALAEVSYDVSLKRSTLATATPEP